LASYGAVALIKATPQPTVNEKAMLEKVSFDMV
jgi:hypothetical protein